MPLKEFIRLEDIYKINAVNEIIQQEVDDKTLTVDHVIICFVYIFNFVFADWL